MNENKKERFTSYLPRDLIAKIREISEETGIPQARLFEKAVRDLVEKQKISVEFFPRKDESDM